MVIFIFLDHVINYEAVDIISNIIILWGPTVSILLTIVSSAITIYTFKTHKSGGKEYIHNKANSDFMSRLKYAFDSVEYEHRQRKREKNKARVWCGLTGILIIFSIVLIALAHSGQYTKQSIDNGSIPTSYTYFGEVNNNVPNGFVTGREK